MTNAHQLALVVAVVFAIIACITLTNIQRAAAVTMSFAVPRVATSSTMQVGPQQVKTIFPTDSTCVNRIVGSASSPLMLAFGATTTVNPTGSTGFTQAASTTVSYPNGDFGCQPIYAYAYSSTTITLTSVITP
jgi:hypothetical protein